MISWRDKLHSVRITSIHSILTEKTLLHSIICKNKSYITFVIDPPLMMAQSRTESTRDTYNYGQYINQFPPNTIKAIREYERIQKKICRQKMSIIFNEICIYIRIYIYIYIYNVNNDCEYSKNECSMHGYLIQNIPAEQNIYFCLKTRNLETFSNSSGC